MQLQVGACVAPPPRVIRVRNAGTPIHPLALLLQLLDGGQRLLLLVQGDALVLQAARRGQAVSVAGTSMAVAVMVQADRAAHSSSGHAQRFSRKAAAAKHEPPTCSSSISRVAETACAGPRIPKVAPKPPPTSMRYLSCSSCSSSSASLFTSRSLHAGVEEQERWCSAAARSGPLSPHLWWQPPKQGSLQNRVVATFSKLLIPAGWTFIR